MPNIEVLDGPSVLPKHFDVVARFAALEVFIRGVGAKQEYNYSIKDVITCAAAYENVRYPGHVSDVMIKQLGGKKTALNLHNAYRRHAERVLAELEGVDRGG